MNPRTRPYLLYVGNVKPHKNLRRLIEAFQWIADEIPHDLVIVGQKSGFITGDDAVISAAAADSRIHFTGHVHETTLQQYMVHATAMVFPSLYEGFGLPPLEAMACGCPVLASDAASIPEVCGEAVCYFNPHSTESLVFQLRRVITDQTLQQELSAKGLRHSRIYSWDQAAKRIVSMIQTNFPH